MKTDKAVKVFYNADMTNLTQIQAEILKVLETTEKANFTEFILAKKIRDNAKISGNKKAGIALSDIEKVLPVLEEKNIFYSIHVNQVNELLFRREQSHYDIDSDGRKRRLASEKSMSIFSSGDLKNSGQKAKLQKRTERKKFRPNDDFENLL